MNLNLPITFIKKFIILKAKKNLKKGFSWKCARNFLGRITVFSKGGLLKKYKLRLVNYSYFIYSNAIILTVEKDLKKNGLIGLIFYLNGLISYILLPELKKKNDILSGFTLNKINLEVGSWSYLYFFPIGSLVFNIELKPYTFGSLARSAGSYGLIINKNKNNVNLKLKSKWKLVISNLSCATLGITSNKIYKTISYKKAGVRRRMGFKSIVRGVAMNPCDHPHGGGEGKKSNKPAARTPWGKLTKNVPTKRKKIQLKVKKLFKIY